MLVRFASLVSLVLVLACSSDPGNAKITSLRLNDAGPDVPLGDAGFETKCTPACTDGRHCELRLVECDTPEDCPWVPTCASDLIDPCATVMCPGTHVCVVTQLHMHTCAELR
jgi:hypothetical protein